MQVVATKKVVIYTKNNKTRNESMFKKLRLRRVRMISNRKDGNI